MIIELDCRLRLASQPLSPCDIEKENRFVHNVSLGGTHPLQSSSSSSCLCFCAPTLMLAQLPICGKPLACVTDASLHVAQCFFVLQSPLLARGFEVENDSSKGCSVYATSILIRMF